MTWTWQCHSILISTKWTLIRIVLTLVALVTQGGVPHLLWMKQEDTIFAELDVERDQRELPSHDSNLSCSYQLSHWSSGIGGRYHLSSATISHTGKLSREKTFANSWKRTFLWWKLSRIAHLCCQRMSHPQILQIKFAQIVTKSRKFSPLKVSGCTICANMPELQWLSW